jgi:hypothetical protein
VKEEIDRNGKSWKESEKRSGGEGAHGSEWLVAGLQSQRFFDFVAEEFGIFGDISIALNAFSAGLLNNFDAVVAAIDAAYAGERTRENTVLDSLGEVFHSLAGLAQLAVDAEGGEDGPAASIAVEVSQATSFN